MQGSSIGAEQRMAEIEIRCERTLGPTEPSDLHTSLSAGLHKQFKEPDFKAIASVMQNQMYSAAFAKDSEKEDSNAFDMTMMQQMMPGATAEEMPEEMKMLMQGANGFDAMSYVNKSKTMAPMSPFNKSATPVAALFKSELLPGAYTRRVAEADLPVEGRISSHYGDRTHPVSGHHHFHSGVDIAAPLGTAIKAPWQGKVVYVGNVSGFGANTVIMAHPETAQKDGKIVYSIFGHNDSVNVAVGDTVAKGDSFATVGSEGRSTGPHLHWETRVAEPGLAGKDIFKHEVSMTVNPLKFC